MQIQIKSNKSYEFCIWYLTTVNTKRNNYCPISYYIFRNNKFILRIPTFLQCNTNNKIYNMSNMSQYQTIPSMYKSIINNHFLNDPQTKAKNVYFLFIPPVSFGTRCHAANNKYITFNIYSNILIYPNFIPKTSNPIFLYFYLG